MTLIDTDAIVLHSADYLESSRILRLATRDAGVQSVLARGARSSRKRFGSALGLFAEGRAQLLVKPGRDLHTLQQFDVTRVRPELGVSIERFTAASALAECVMRIVHDEQAQAVYDGIVAGVGRIAATSDENVVSVTLGVLWRLISDIGFTPSLDACAVCHDEIDAERDVYFSNSEGGALCARCSTRGGGGRRLPAAARAQLRAWLSDGAPEPASTDAARDSRSGNKSAPPLVSLAAPEQKAHQRLFREFLTHHAPDTRAMRAFGVWESGAWASTVRGTAAAAE